VRQLREIELDQEAIAGFIFSLREARERNQEETPDES